MAPAVALAVGILALSTAAWLSVPLQLVFPWLRGLLAVLAAIGLGLIWRDRHRIRGLRRLGVPLGAVIVLLPLVVLPTALTQGPAVFANSDAADVWSYVATSDYLAVEPRGADGGLSPLHQYAAHLAATRHATPAVLGFLANFAGMPADSLLLPFCLLVLLVLAGSSAALGCELGTRGLLPAIPAVLVTTGWAANTIVAGNLDQFLLMALLPALATAAARAGDGDHPRRWAVVAGVLTAGAFHAFPELAPMGTLAALAFAMPSQLPRWAAIRRLCLIGAVVLPVAILLLGPLLTVLPTYVANQLSSTSIVGQRPGEGYFAGLTDLQYLVSAVSAFGGEHKSDRLMYLDATMGAALVGLAIAGVAVQARRWLPGLAMAATAALFCYFAFVQTYSYAAYKILAVNAWLLAFFTAAGWNALISAAGPGWYRPVLQRLGLMALVVVVSMRVSAQDRRIDFTHNIERVKAYQELRAAAAVIGPAPALLSVREPFANSWAVFNLARADLLVMPLRLYMAQPHVVPFMTRARPVAPAAIRYIVTDRDDGSRALVTGARRLWSGRAYTLWSADPAGWAVVADLAPTAGPAGEIGIAVTIVAAEDTVLPLDIQILPTEAARPRWSGVPAVLSDAGGERPVLLAADGHPLPVAAHAGSTAISVVVTDPAAAAALRSGTAILRLRTPADPAAALPLR